MSVEDEPSAPAASATKAPSNSKRSQRKAAQRAKKQQQESQSNTNKATSQHPEAILKRQRQKEEARQPRKNNRRNHNFADRAQFLQDSEEGSDEFDVPLDDLTNISKHPEEDPNGQHPNGVHKLHSTAVDRLDDSTTADEVVQAIKRAQNLHDVHDIREIAHFLLEEVGEFC